MKTIILILLLAGFSLGSSDNPAATPDKMATASKKIPWYKKLEVVRFVELVLEDEAQEYRNAEAWLKHQKFSNETYDQCLEFLSGMVYEKDKARGRRLTAGFKTPGKREEILAQYDATEKNP